MTVRSLIAAHWHGMHDADSGISKIEAWAGTTPGADDILSSQIVHAQNFFVYTLESSVPSGSSVYTTIKVVNNAGEQILYFSEQYHLSLVYVMSFQG